MKKIKYAILGYTGVFHPETEEVEEKEVVSYSIMDPGAKVNANTLFSVAQELLEK